MPTPFPLPRCGSGPTSSSPLPWMPFSLQLVLTALSSPTDHAALQKPWVSIDTAGILPGSSAQSKTRALSQSCSSCLSWPHSDAAHLFGDTGHPAPALRG
jgi:hypothetical protein